MKDNIEERAREYLKHENFGTEFLYECAVKELTDFEKQNLATIKELEEKVKELEKDQVMDKLYSETAAESFITDWYERIGHQINPDKDSIEMVAYLIRNRVKLQRELQTLKEENDRYKEVVEIEEDNGNNNINITIKGCDFWIQHHKEVNNFRVYDKDSNDITPT